MSRGLTLCLLAALPLVAPVEVATVSLAKLVEGSAAIVVGTVDSVTNVEGVSVAHVKVTEVVKGDPKVERLAFVAQSTWRCDISTAVRGETALLFLADLPDGVSSWTEGRNWKTWGQSLGKEPGYLLAHSGRGRMPVHEGSSDRHVQVCGDIVEATTWLAPCETCAYRYRRPLPEMLADVRRILEEQAKAAAPPPK